MSKLVPWVLVCLTLSSSATTLEEAKDGFLANVGQVPSGSVTYQIEFHRPKENLLAVPPNRMKIPGLQEIPVLKGEEDVTLRGWGSFEWEGEKWVSRVQRVYLSTLPDSLLSPEVHDSIECWDGEVKRLLTARYACTSDPLNEEASPSDRGDLLERSAGIQAKMRVFHLVFLPLEYFCPSLGKTVDVFSQFATISSVEGGLLELSDGGPRGDSVKLDPTQGFMPVAFDRGHRTREVEYRQIEGAWFPTKMTGQTVGAEDSTASVLCTLTTHEFNKDYPDSDFTISFPPGTRVEDEVEGTEYTALASE